VNESIVTQSVKAMSSPTLRADQAEPLTSLDVERMRASLHGTFNGGHRDPAAMEAFHHGMDTVCNVLAAHQRGESTNGIPVASATPSQPRSPAEALAESCRSWLPGLTAQGDRLAVPLLGPSGTLSVQVTLIQPSPWTFVTSDATIMAAYRALGEDAESIAGFSLDCEGDELQSDGFAVHTSHLPALFASLRDGLIALLYAADMLTPEPAPAAEPFTEIDLQLSQIAETVAHEFYKVLHYLSGGAGYGVPWEKVPADLRQELRVKAERAVRTVDAIREGHARRHARLWLQASLRETFEQVWQELTDSPADRPLQYLLRAALTRVENRLAAVDPAEQMFSVYERVLQFGPEAAWVKPLRIRREKGGA
jgi:hypothetical protein